MKIIDLLNKIANGENISNNYMKYFNRQDQKYDICLTCFANLLYKLDNDIIELNDEVEILEEKKIPEKLSTWYSVEVIQSDEENVEYENYNFKTMYEKINEICDYLKSKGEL